MSNLKQTPLHDLHVQLKARMGEFAGFDMPIYYQGILQEHQAVRHAVGLFDLCHMGRIWVKGKGAFDFLQWVVTNDLKKLKERKIIYSPVCNSRGMVLDDILIYQFQEEEFLLIVNASNIQKDFDWLFEHGKEYDVSIVNESGATGFLALQGPLSYLVLEKMMGEEIDRISYYHFQEMKWRGKKVIVSRTGYTGEDGFEIYLSKQDTIDFWQEALQAGQEHGILPIGLGARDTLRLEMRYLLYGHDMNEETTALEAGLGWTISFNKGDFVGRQSLEVQRQKGLIRRLVGFEMIDQGIPRQAFSIVRDEKEVGRVTSGSYSPTLGKNIGLAYVDIGYAHAGIPIYVVIREQQRLAEVVKTPFYKGGGIAHRSKTRKYSAVV